MLNQIKLKKIQFLIKFFLKVQQIIFKHQVYLLFPFYFNYFNIHKSLIYYHAQDMQFYPYL